MNNKKQRIDSILVEKGFFDTKSQAQAAILAGDVKIDDKPVLKAGTPFKIEEVKNVDVKTLPFVSRGGFKLDKAIKEFQISVNDKICMDAGASTGGFTDCLLQNGAKKVYAVDVGYGQLAWKLRSDDRVVVIERQNIRHSNLVDIYSTDVPEENYAEITVMDLSFISVNKVLANIKKLMHPINKEIVTLIKPQFEAGKEFLEKNGVVKDKNVHINVIKQVWDYAISIDLYPVGLAFSPIKGPKGNREYLLHLKSKALLQDNVLDDTIIETVVNKAHEQL